MTHAKSEQTIIKKKSLRMCILGGGGYIGQSLAKALQKNNHFVVLYDIKFSIFPHIVLNSSKLLKVQGSILDSVKLREVLIGCDACFHLVGYGMSGGASLNKKMTFLINYEGTKIVVNECRKAKIKRIIFSSSIAVTYDGKETNFADETVPYSKKFPNYYAESKCLAEKIIIDASYEKKFNYNFESIDLNNDRDKDFCLATCALRFRGIYGPGEQRSTQRAVDLIRQGLLVGKFKKTKNESKTQYTSCENCVNALILAEECLREPNSSAIGQIYNIVDGGDPVNNFDFWNPLIESVGGRIPQIYIPFCIIYYLAFFFELLYLVFGIEPIFTRFETELMAINNTYSIEKAKRDLKYCPTKNHDLTATIHYFKQQQQLQLAILNS